MPEKPKYRRVLMKLSGEAFGPGQGQGIDMRCVAPIAREMGEMRDAGVQLAVVIGGGNIVRGVDLIAAGMKPAQADTIGMLATVINGLALHDILSRMGIENRLQTAIPMNSVAEPYIRERCVRHLEKDRVMVLAAGTGSPHFTTDTAAALRAREIGADVLLKGTNVDAVYSADPRRDAAAHRYNRLTYEDVLHQDLRVMDATAVTLCREGGIPIIVFDRSQPGNLRKAVFGEPVGTYIGEKCDVG